jgi:NAD(P)-dependent dehydrogenase (short-subunit alcohol dehydrogenase family)
MQRTDAAGRRLTYKFWRYHYRLMADSRIVLVTGASSGIGKACAELLPVYGFKVIPASRHHSEFTLDVTSDASVERLVAEIIEREGRIDAVVNNAGIVIAGAIEDTTPLEALHQLETNLLGTLRVTRAVLPHMRKQGSGKIVNIGSIGGLLAIPYQGLYSASKFAIEGLTEALRLEVKQFGIHASVIEPGGHRTAITQNRVRTSASIAGSAYSAGAERAIGKMAKDEQDGPDPSGVARIVLRVLETRRPRLRYTTGPAIQRAAVLLKRVAPYSLIERIVDLYY